MSGPGVFNSVEAAAGGRRENKGARAGSPPSRAKAGATTTNPRTGVRGQANAEMQAAADAPGFTPHAVAGGCFPGQRTQSGPTHTTGGGGGRTTTTGAGATTTGAGATTTGAGATTTSSPGSMNSTSDT
jgi:hypothetical protein